ncbi:succinylglutamate desuccinylase/aspartoacylase family protein [uncultured Neptuniibacter sp.]|uniref:succinylglutamate desuccinylase/aspartoacylase domain-containing protein n=1 Tax=uncultured Neptuniibacter sp. TaxID=502143 RepID=UPI002604BA14|nr:succinylglutamate desuccinylase/aspartoacylase family protein [uncultured Neptuniibacter sp.]
MKKLFNPTAAELKNTPEAFLREISEAVMIFIEGESTDRTRGLVTLLHGNEPSGLLALHKWLLRAEKPLCNLICFIPSVPAAILEPMFRNRVYPGQRDMNRCFFPPYDDLPGALAEEILELFEEYKPECILDIHNTSGHSPDFGVVTYESREHEALVSLFCDRMVVTDLRLGALMERSVRRCPVVTIECGGVDDAGSAAVAWNGLQKYFYQEDVMTLEHGHHMDLYRHPVRLELKPKTVIAYADSYVIGTDITVPTTLDRCNFGTVERGQLIGWMGSRMGRDCLRAHDANGEDVFERFFELRGNQLMTAQPLKLFMITTRPDIAIGDCLLYAAEEREHQVVDT